MKTSMTYDEGVRLEDAVCDAMVMECLNSAIHGGAPDPLGHGVWASVAGQFFVSRDGDDDTAGAVRVVGVEELSAQLDADAKLFGECDMQRAARNWTIEHGAEALAKTREELTKG